MPFLQNTRKRSSRRGWPIMGYVGSNGGGKSACMVWDTLPSLERGRPVLSTVRLLDYLNPRDCAGCEDPGHFRPVYGSVRVEDLEHAELSDEERARLLQESILEDELGEQLAFDAPRLTVDRNGFPLRDVLGYVTHKAAHPLWVPFTRWEQLLEARGCDVLMDEVTGVASSRESQAMPSPVANKLVQLRRADVVVRWSAPSWARADKIIRECSQAVTYCEGMLPKVAPGQGDRQWRQRRLFKWKTYDASDFEDFTSGKREQLRALGADLHWGPKSPVFSAYDTYDSVSVIGTVTDSGRCYQCGGRRSIPACKCPADHSSSVDAGQESPGGPRRGSGDAPGSVGRRSLALIGSTSDGSG